MTELLELSWRWYPSAFLMAAGLGVAAWRIHRAVATAVRSRDPWRALAIAKGFLIPRQGSDHGLSPGRLDFTDEAIDTLVDLYTREAGVRNLEQKVAALCRAIAVRLAEGEDVHQWVGYFAVAWIAVRTAWGFLGSGAARWADFWPTPARVARHVRALLAGRDPRHLGHSPLGALVMILMIAGVLALGLTGFLHEEVDYFWGEEWVQVTHARIADDRHQGSRRGGVLEEVMKARQCVVATDHGSCEQPSPVAHVRRRRNCRGGARAAHASRASWNPGIAGVAWFVDFWSADSRRRVSSPRSRHASLLEDNKA